MCRLWRDAGRESEYLENANTQLDTMTQPCRDGRSTGVSDTVCCHHSRVHLNLGLHSVLSVGPRTTYSSVVLYCTGFPELTGWTSPAAACECKEVELINGTDADGTIDRASSMSASLLLYARD